MAVKVVIREEFEIDLCDTEEQLKTITVRELMERIAEREGAAESERIILCDGEKLEDDRRLSDCGVKHMSVLQMRRRVRGGASPDREPGAGGMGEKEYKRKSESEQTISFDGEKFGGDPPLTFLPCWEQTKESYFPRGSTPDREPGAGGMGENEYKRKRETESEQTMLYDGENLNDERLQLEEAMDATCKRRRKINRRRGLKFSSRDCLIDPEEPRSGDSCPGATPEQEPGAGGMGDKKGKNRSKENLLSF